MTQCIHLERGAQRTCAEIGGHQLCLDCKVAYEEWLRMVSDEMVALFLEEDAVAREARTQKARVGVRAWA